MNRISFLLLTVVLSSSLWGAEIKTKSSIEKATVYINGAQVFRSFNASVPKGRSILQFEGLASEMEMSSVQISLGTDQVVLVSIRQQFDYLNVEKKGEELIGLKDTIDLIKAKIEDRQTKNRTLQMKINMINQNQSIVSNLPNDAVGQWKQMYAFNTSEQERILMAQLQIQRDLKVLNELLSGYQNQYNELSRTEVNETAILQVEVESQKAATLKGELSYLVYAAGWFPTYDIRATNLNNPLEVRYKATVYQNTGVDWDDVQLTFSNADPRKDGNIPELRPYYLQLNRRVYKKQYSGYQAVANRATISNSQSRVARGKVVDRQGQPIPFATIQVVGRSVGAISDIDGNFSLTLPNDARQVRVTYVGYTPATINLNPGQANRVILTEITSNVETVEVQNSWNHRENSSDDVQRIPMKSTSKLAAVSIRKEKGYVNRAISGRRNQPKAKSSYAIMATTPLQNNTTFEVTLDTKYTLSSDGRPKTATILSEKIPAYYEHQCVPKLDKSAYLIARITDWDQYNFLEGEANLYFEDTYVGKTVLDVRFISDTLDISLGVDRNILVNRTKVKSYSGNEFIGSDRVEKRKFTIQVRNQKASNVNLVIFDQVPVSNEKSITVELKESSGAEHVVNTGELVWRMTLPPNESKSVDFQYTVKYPRSAHIQLE
jgi:uncharacterized protein (TIGR02231 family)